MEQFAVGRYGGLCRTTLAPSAKFCSAALHPCIPAVATTAGFSKFPSGRTTSRVSRVQTRMADSTAEAPTSQRGVPMKTRKIVDHLVLFKMIDTLDEFQEKEMLDGLYSLQYQIKDIICSSLGPLTKKTPDNYTHALFTRFTTVQAVQDYMVHPMRGKVAKELVIPYYAGLCIVDFEAEVEDDMEPIFRRGDRFQTGVEQFVMFKFKENTPADVVAKSIDNLKTLDEKFGSEIVQKTMGVNFEPRTLAYFSHAIVRRFESESSYEEYKKFLENEPSWVELKAVTENLIECGFNVSPVGKTLM